MTRVRALAGLGLAVGAAVWTTGVTHEARAHDPAVRVFLGATELKSGHDPQLDCKTEHGVRVCAWARAAITSPIAAPPLGAAALDDRLAGREPVRVRREVVIVEKRVIERRYHPPRRLRSQGFWSGKGPRSKRFTQGFFSDRVAAER
ncbi:MAG: hypothetical protein AAGC56_00235 [Pseudomonadota bacterium]